MKLSPKRAWIRRPGDDIHLRIDGDRYTLVVPDTYTCLSIAADYRWWDLVPGCLLDGDRDRVEELLLDRESVMSFHMLHYVVQSAAQLIYGWPMFSAGKICGTLRVGEPLFRMWCASNGQRPDESWSAADWCSAAVAWFMASQGKKEEQQMVLSQLQSPTVLDSWGPGVTPRWVTEMER